MRLFVFSSNITSKIFEIRTIEEREASSGCLEKQESMENHPPKEKSINLREEEPGSASNERIYEKEEEGMLV